MVMNSCVENLEGTIRLTRMRISIPRVEEKRNELVEVSRDSRFWRRELLADLVNPAESSE